MMNKPRDDLMKKWKTALRISQLLYCLLLVNLTIDHWLFYAPKLHSPLLIGLLTLLPLLIFLPGIIKGSPRWLAWLCFVTLFYFISAVVHAWLPPNPWPSLISIVLCILLFSSNMFVVRWYYRAEKQ